MSSGPTHLSEREERFGEIAFAYLRAIEEGCRPVSAEWLARYAEFSTELACFIADLEHLDRSGAPLRVIVQALAWPSISGTPALSGPLPHSFADYELVEELGRGGMGVVCKARHLSLNRDVALKMILAGHFASADDVQRFRREAEAAASLDHAHIVPIYDVGEHDGRPYFTMKLIVGISLAQSPPIATRGVVELMVKVARAVHHAHQRGVLHRDLKPGNILLDEAGEPHVTDFGLAKRLTADASGASAATAVGTPGYVAPEQLLGAKGGVSTAADVYGLGAVLYYLLTGRPPFHGGTPLDVVRRVLEEEPEPPRGSRSEVPRDLETICLKCLHKDPARRYADAAALADDLQRFLAGEPILARRAGIRERVAQWARRRPFAVALIAVSLLALFGAVAGMAWHTTRLGEALTTVQEREGRLKEALATGKAREREVRCHLYVTDMRLGHQFFWKNGTVPAMRAQLARHVPGPGNEDNRDFAWHYLDHLSHLTEALTLYGHDGDVFGVAYSPDGRRLASAGADGTVRLWDPATLQSRALLRGHKGAVRAVAFAPDGLSLATTGDDGTVRLWNPGDGTKRRHWMGHAGGAACLAFSPDGKRLVTGGRDRHARLWDAATGRELDHSPCNTSVCALAFLGDGETIKILESARGTMPTSWIPGKKQQSGGVSAHSVLCLAAVPHTMDVVEGLSPGEVLLTGSAGGSLSRNERLSAVRAVAVSPDGRYAASGGDDTMVHVWDCRQRTARFVGKGHAAPVWGVAFAPDSRQIASASADGTVKLWDWDIPQDYETLHPDLEASGPAAFAADGRTMALACRDGTLRILDPATWHERCRLTHLAGDLHAVALSADGRAAATAGDDCAVRLWDSTSGRQEARIATAAVVDCLAFSPDGTLLALGLRDGSAWLWHRNGGAVQLLVRLPASLSAVAFSPNGPILAAAAGTSLVLWDVAKGKERTRLSAETAVQHMAFTHDGRTLVTAGTDPRVAFWNVTAPAAPLFTTEITGAVTGPLAVSPNDRRVAVVHENRVVLVDVATRSIVRRLNGHEQPASALGFCAAGQRLVSVRQNGPVRSWNLASGAVDSPPDQPLADVRALAFTPDGRTLITGSHDPPQEIDSYPVPGSTTNYRTLVPNRTPEAVRLWDPSTGRQRAALPLPVAVSLQCLALARDGQTAAAGCTAGIVCLWDLPSGRARRTLFTNPAERIRWQRVDALLKWRLPIMERFDIGVQAITFSPDGRLLATANNAGRVQLWDTISGDEVRTLCDDHGDTTALAFAPDGATLALNRGATVELWDVASRRLRQTLAGHTAAVNTLAYSADGRILASGGQDWAVKLWDPVTGQVQAALVGHRAFVNALAFSPDGRTLASGGQDQAVRLWHIATGQELLALATTHSVVAVAFAPDGRTLAGGGGGLFGRGEVYLWRAPGLPQMGKDGPER